jgi:hypothetical protein
MGKREGEGQGLGAGASWGENDDSSIEWVSSVGDAFSSRRPAKAKRRKAPVAFAPVSFW